MFILLRRSSNTMCNKKCLLRRSDGTLTTPTAALQRMGATIINLAPLIERNKSNSCHHNISLNKVKFQVLECKA